MVIKIDLLPNRSLLNANFECYRLTLEPLPVLKKSLNTSSQKVRLEDDQYGFLHVQMTGLLNALVQDPWDFSTVFFVTEAHHVVWVQLSQDNQLSEPRIVWQIPEPEGVPCTWTLGLPHPEWCLISDGTGRVYILNSPSRPEGEPWQLCHTYCPDWIQPSSVLMTSAHYSFPSNEQIECLVGCICRPQDVQGSVNIPETTVHFVCVLEWLTFSSALTAGCTTWTLKRRRRLVGASVPMYSAFDTLGGCLCLASEKEFSFVFDSCKAKIGHEVEDAVTKVKEPPLYSYIQTGDTLTVVFKLPESVAKTDVTVEIGVQTIQISICEKVVLKGEFPHTVMKSASTWTMLDQKLEVHLTKAEAGVVWKEVVQGDTRGEEVFDPGFVEEIHARLAHLTSDVEAKEAEKPPYNYQELDECDDTSEFFSFTRHCGNSHRTTHQINLSGHQWLFKVQTSPSALPALCLRHDVDGLVWQPKNVASDGDADPFRMEHIATFNAFGYVQASKQDRKFELGAPDFSFAAICDSVRHVYLYRQPESLDKSVELRNRKTGKEVSTIAKQHVISLERCDMILGMVASPHCIFVLSPDTIYAIRTSSS